MSFLDKLNRSLRGRLLLSLSLGLSMCLGGLFFAFDGLVDRELYARFDASLTNRARAIAVFFGARSDLAALESYLPQFSLGQHREFFQVWDAQGQVIARSRPSGDVDLGRPFSVGRNPTHYDTTLPDGHAGRAVAQAFALPAGDPRGSLFIVIAEERDQIDALEARLHYILSAGVVLTLLITLLLARFSVARSLAPVRRYAAAVAAIEHGPAAKAPDAGDLPSELAPVAQRFSDALNAVLDAVERERRFARDVAHELRTPIAEAQALVDVSRFSPSVACEGGLALAAPHADQMTKISDALSDLEQIVSTLLQMARYEAKLEQPQSEPLDLALELREQIQRTSGAAQLRKLTVNAQLVDAAWVIADPVMISRMVANLLDNAIAHAPHGTSIDIRLAGPPWSIEIRNAAPALHAEEAAQLGNRFYRAASADNGGHHAGLGLALTHSMAAALGLMLEARLEQGILSFVLRGFRSLDEPSRITAGRS